MSLNGSTEALGSYYCFSIASVETLIRLISSVPDSQVSATICTLMEDYETTVSKVTH